MFLRKKAHNLFAKAERPHFMTFKPLSERIAELKTREEELKRGFSAEHTENAKPKKIAKPKKTAGDVTPEAGE